MAKSNKDIGVKLVKQKVGENIYLFNVPVAYAAVHRPDKKYESNDTEYKLTAFLTAEQREFLENEAMVNKTICEVDVDRNKKRKIKYTSEAFPFAEGLHGLQLTRPSHNKEGNPTSIIVIQNVNGKGVEFTDDIGNGSVCTLKLWGYRNKDELLNVQLDTVVVVDHIPYEGGNGTVEDDILGVTYSATRNKNESKPDPIDEFETTDDVEEDDDY